MKTIRNINLYHDSSDDRIAYILTLTNENKKN